MARELLRRDVPFPLGGIPEKGNGETDRNGQELAGAYFSLEVERVWIWVMGAE